MLQKELVDRIVSGNEKLASFWGSSHGWAPVEAADLMSKSRLDWQVELSCTLRIWDFQFATSGQLILAWANLGALVEGTLKLFLSAYYLDYLNDSESYEHKGEVLGPEILALERIKQFYRKRQLLDLPWYSYIEKIQQRRNAIHAFKDRPIGDEKEFSDCVKKYLDLMLVINSMLPYPTEEYRPRF